MKEKMKNIGHLHARKAFTKVKAFLVVDFAAEFFLVVLNYIHGYLDSKNPVVSKC